MKKIIGIYKITSPSGKIYIGQSKHCLFRWKYHYSKLLCKRQRHLYNSFLKYGYDNHVFEILKECNLEDLDDLEIKYIQRYNSTDKTIGMNLRAGGNGVVISDETRDLMRQNALGNTNMLGKTHSKETRKLISENRKGIKPSKETKKKMSKARKGHKHSQETKNKLSKANKFTRKIKNVKTNISHDSITQAAIDENISQSTIYRGLKDGRYEYI